MGMATEPPRDRATSTHPAPSRHERQFDAGVYVLGALSPSERYAFERHLATCAQCRDDVVWLAGLRGLLGRLSTSDVVAYH